MLSAGYRYFYSIAQERSIRKAADRVHISASAMSRQIALLEDELGQPLMERRARGIVLTEAGSLLAEHIRRLMSQEQELRADISSLGGLRNGHVRVALGNGFAATLASMVVPEFAERHPGMTYELTVAPSDGIVRALDEEEADMGLMITAPLHPSVEVVASFPAPLMLVTAPGHRLAGRKKGAGMAELQREPLALLKASHGVRQILQRIESLELIRLQPVMETNSYEVLKIFVASGLGVTVLPKIAVMNEITAGILAAVPLVHQEFASATVSIVQRRGRKLPLAASEFLKVLTQKLDAGR